MIRRFVVAFFALAFAFVPSAGPLAAVPSPSEFPPPPISVRTLASGLKVVVVESHAVPVVQVAMWYRFGANEEVAGKTGLAHALEHMMFRGTKSLSDAGLDDTIARFGAQVNANTTNDATHFYALIPADRLGVWLRIEADRMHNLALQKREWDIEKGAVLQEYDADLSQPIGKLIMAVNKAAYPGDPIGRGALGERSDIVRSTVADLRAYYERWYAPNNAVLVITGDVEPKAAFDLAESAFASVRSKALPRPRINPAKATSGAQIEQVGDVPFETVDIAYAIPGQKDRAVIAPILIALAAENARSPIRSALVNSQIALQYGTSPALELRGSIFHLLITLRPGRTASEARAAWENAFKRTFIDDYPADLIDAAKRAAIVQDVYDRDSLTGLGELVGNSFGVERGTYPNADNADIANITRDEIVAAAKQYFAKPTVVARVRPRVLKKGDETPDTSRPAIASDSFTGRAPSGSSIVQPAYVKDAFAKRTEPRSHVAPTAYTLANGLRLLVEEAHDNPTVTISGRVANSPRSDPPGKEGASAMLSSMLGYGSAKYTFEASRTIADELAADISYGGAFGARGLSRDFTTLLDVLADDLRAPSLPAEFFPLVRDSIRANVERRAFDPDYRAARAFDEALLPPGDPALRQPTTQTLAALTLDDVRAQAKQILRPENTVLVVVGDVKAETVRERVTAALGSWTNDGTGPDLRLPAIPEPKGKRIDIATQASDVAVRLGQPAIARAAADYDAFSLLDQIFGGESFDSRLFKEVRMRRGLVYSVGSSLEAAKDRGVFEIGLRASPANVATAVSVVKTEMRRLQNEPVSRAELDRARTRIVGSTFIAEQSKETLVGDLLNIAENGLPLDYYMTLAQRYAAIDSAAVQRVAKQYLRPDGMIEVFQGAKLR